MSNEEKEKQSLQLRTFGTSSGQALSQGRIMSIDALRGFDMFWIIGGWSIFRGLHEKFDNSTTQWLTRQMSHVKWEGFTPWDLIMPLFLFVVGVVMPFAFNKRLELGHSKSRLYRHIIMRFVILFILGMIAQGRLLEYDLSQLRIFSNTLQAIAVGYVISAVIILNLKLVWQLITTGALLLLFWALMMLIPVPGHGAGVLTPEGNLAIYIDRLVLGSFIDGTDPPYTWILSGMTFTCTVMLGVFAGHLLRSKKSNSRKVLLLAAMGIGSLLLGWIWNDRLWIFSFPIIKHLWTSSFVLYSAGWCFLLLALFYLVIDVLGLKKWAFPFVVIGMNAIAVYMATHVFNFRHIGDIFVGGLEKWCGPWNGFIQAVAAFAVIWLILLWMYRKKTFIKI